MRISDWSSDVCSSDLVDKSQFEREAAIILAILNDAWSHNWGFVPLTQPEIDDVGKKLKPIVFNDLIRIAELDGRPVAFMITLPDLNEAIRPLGGKLLPFGWAKLLWRSEEHTSELQSLMRISYAVFSLNKKTRSPHAVIDVKQ